MIPNAGDYTPPLYVVLYEIGLVGVGEIGKFGVNPLELSIPTKPTLTTLDVNLHGVLYSE